MLNEEIEFCNYFEKVMLPNRRNITTEMVQTAGNIIHKSMNTTCGSCLHGSAIDLMNLYNRLLPKYEEYKKKKDEVVQLEKDTMDKWLALEEIEPKMVFKPKKGFIKVGKFNNQLWFKDDTGKVEYKDFKGIQNGFIKFDGGIITIEEINK